MMFGRKKKQDQIAADVEEPGGDLLEDDELEEADETEVDNADEEDTDVRDEWDELDDSRDWRDDGPFDIGEVDLDDDTVQRLDFGSLILTPFDGMQLNLQADQATGIIHAALAIVGNSALEVALFAAPQSGGLAREARRDLAEHARAEGGTAEFAEGPFGTELRRIIPVTAPDGQQGVNVSRMWLVEGPRWMLRGTLMGEICMDQAEGADHDFLEFFRNVIVRRGREAKAPGEVVGMQLPDDLRPVE